MHRDTKIKTILIAGVYAIFKLYYTLCIYKIQNPPLHSNASMPQIILQHNIEYCNKITYYNNLQP